MNPAQVAKMMQESASDTVMLILNKAKDLDKSLQTRVLSGMFGRLAVNDINMIAENIPALIKNLEMVSEKSDSDTVRSEADIFKQSMAARFDMFNNQVDELKIRLGSALLPGLKGFRDSWTKCPGRWRRPRKDMAGPIAESDYPSNVTSRFSPRGGASVTASSK